MKKILLIICISLCLISFCSCVNENIIYGGNITWINEDFNIKATSEQLKRQNYEYNDNLDDSYYSSIYILGENKTCTFNFFKGMFSILLIDSKDDSIVYFYGNETAPFITGSYDIKFETGKEYKYSIIIYLNDYGQYYEYCKDNNIFYPFTTVLYGYEVI